MQQDELSRKRAPEKVLRRKSFLGRGGTNAKKRQSRKGLPQEKEFVSTTCTSVLEEIILRKKETQFCVSFFYRLNEVQQDELSRKRAPEKVLRRKSFLGRGGTNAKKRQSRKGLPQEKEFVSTTCTSVLEEIILRKMETQFCVSFFYAV